MIINFRQLIQPTYLLARYNAPLSRNFLYAWLAAGAILFFGGVALRLALNWRTATPPVWARWVRRVATMLSTSGFVTFVCLFFRYERVPFFSARILIIAWILATLAWAGYLVYLAIKWVPRDLAAWQERQRIEKYLPRKQ